MSDDHHDDSIRTSPLVTSRPRTVMTADNASWFRVFGVAGQIGYMISIPAVLFVMGGAWLDSYLGTKPMFTLLGIPLALMVSALSVWRMIRQVQRKENV